MPPSLGLGFLIILLLLLALRHIQVYFLCPASAAVLITMHTQCRVFHWHLLLHYTAPRHCHRLTGEFYGSVYQFVLCLLIIYLVRVLLTLFFGSVSMANSHLHLLLLTLSSCFRLFCYWMVGCCDVIISHWSLCRLCCIRCCAMLYCNVISTTHAVDTESCQK